MIPARPDLLIVGGLTIDRLSDGRTLPGGSVLHAARAVAAAGRRVATITAAGQEPAARAALVELAGLGLSRVTAVPACVHFAIHEERDARRLVLENAGSAVPVTRAVVRQVNPRAVLFAPVAGELSAAEVRAADGVTVRVATLQGWLRHLSPGDEARPMGLEAIDPPLVDALSRLDGLVASEQDLAAVAPDPRGQLAGLRRRFGARPILVITAGAGGAWLDDPAGGILHLAVSRTLDEASTIGAGDAFAGLLAMWLCDGLTAERAVASAMDGAAAYLAARR